MRQFSGEGAERNLKRDIAQRELKAASKVLNNTPEKGEIIHINRPGPGNVVTFFEERENVTEVFTGIGQHRVRAETLAKEMAQAAKEYLTSDAAVDVHLADQLLLPMALMGGGVFTATAITQHTRTNIDIIRPERA